jgi:hypothetical protein
LVLPRTSVTSERLVDERGALIMVVDLGINVSIVDT